MKNLKRIYLVVVLLFIFSCGSSGDGDSLGELTVSGSLDTKLLTNLNGNDATKLVTLNGQAAATYTTEAAVGSEISYEITTSSTSVEIVIIDFFYTSGNRELWENSIETSVNTQSASASLKIVGGAVGDEVKFGFTFVLKTNGVIDMNTTYIVDPKIKVRS